MAKAVTDAPAEEEEGAEGQRVASDDPLQVSRREVQPALDRRERDVDDAEVELEHELGCDHESEAVPIRWAFEVVLVIDAGPLDGERAGGSEPSLAPRISERRLISIPRDGKVRAIRLPSGTRSVSARPYRGGLIWRSTSCGWPGRPERPKG